MASRWPANLGIAKVPTEYMDVDVRLFYTLIRGILGIILLFNLSFITTYPVVHQLGIANAGLSPINSSVITPTDLDATAEFWWLFPSLMTDQAAIVMVPSLTCSGSSCLSYFIPGPIVFDPNMPPITDDDFPGATAWAVDAPGYQIDYSPVTTEDPILLPQNDCEPYGIDYAAILICVKQTGSSIIGGTLLNTWKFGSPADPSCECLSIRGCKPFVLLQHYRLDERDSIQVQSDNNEAACYHGLRQVQLYNH